MPRAALSIPSRDWFWLRVWPLRLLLPAFCLPVLLLLAQALQTAPPRAAVEHITLALPPGGSRVLGWRELAAPQAEESHVRVVRNSGGSWQIVNVSQNLAVEVQRDGRDEWLRGAVLTVGQRFSIAGQGWRVAAIAPDLRVEAEGGAGAGWWFSGAQAGSMQGAEPRSSQAMCADAGWAARLRAGWNAVMPTAFARPIRLEWGGHVACEAHIPVPGLEPGAVWAERGSQGFVLRATAAAGRAVCVLPQAGDATLCARAGLLHEQGVPLDTVSRLVVGRAQYLVSIDGDRLHLQPFARMAWMPPALAQEQAKQLRAAGIVWTLRPEDAWRLPAFLDFLANLHWQIGVAAAALLATAILALAARRCAGARRQPGSNSAALGVVVSLAWLGLGGFGFIFASTLGNGWFLLSVAGSVLLLTLIPWCGFLPWINLAGAVMLMFIGLTTQFSLGLQASDSGGWLYFRKAAAALTLIIPAWVALAFWIRLRALRPTPRWRTQELPGWWSLAAKESMVWGLALAALLGLLLQAVLGAEEGVFGLQPVELAKLALVISSAHVLALRLEYGQGQGGWQQFLLWARAVVPILLFVGLVALSLVLLDDYSPLLLLIAWLLGMCLAWTVASGNPWGAALGILGVLAVGCLHQWAQQPAALAWLMEHGFYPDRFAVWIAPLRHPHSGEQFLRASRLLVQGGWEGDVTVAGWRVPAVQFDFTPAFFIGRFGVGAALALLLLQSLWLAALLTLGWQRLHAAPAGDFVAQWQARLTFFAVWGFGFLFAGHFLLSWGTNMGWLPVMGQPMPLVSAGNSLLLLLLAPFLGLLVNPPAIEQ
jgi:cell division protein FtsW